MVRIITFLTLTQAASLLVLGAGCASSTPGRSAGLQATPTFGQQTKPNPVKQLATKVGESSFGKSMSKAFGLTSTKNKAPHIKDPVSLAEKPKPPDAALYVSLGDLRVRENDAEGAREMYHKALSMEPHHLGALLGLARLFDRQGQLDRAAQHYVEATKHHPKEAAAFNDLGLCYARQGKYDEAVAALQRAVELMPDRVLYRNNIATVLVAQGRVDEALVHMTDAHGVAAAHYNIGYLLNKRGRQRQALNHFALALQADPKMTAAQDWVDSLSAQAGGDSQGPMYTASNFAPADFGDARQVAASAGAATHKTAAVPAREPEIRVVEAGDAPFNRLRDPERFGAASQEAQSDAASGGPEPAADNSAASEQNAPPEPAAQEPREPRLQYLPSVNKDNARPSRY